MVLNPVQQVYGPSTSIVLVLLVGWSWDGSKRKGLVLDEGKDKYSTLDPVLDACGSTDLWHSPLPC